jgi:hypothetical protein
MGVEWDLVGIYIGIAWEEERTGRPCSILTDIESADMVSSP